jgi:glycosyltransferase involved in cell wall biosynthesis
MRVSVAVCTWNRSQLLQQSLEQMTHLIIPPGLEWELLIVNNACTDATDHVIGSFLPRLPLRRLIEPSPGLSHARNLAVGEARGDYILWTDDDVLVDENWLAAYVEAFQRWPRAVFFGGPVQPYFAEPPPAWLSSAWRIAADAYALRDLGHESLSFTGGDCIPYGANFAVRTKEQRQYRYDPSLGHRQERKIGGEETQFARELISKGYDGKWVPEAAVRHYISAERMSRRYLRSYYFGHGQSLAWTSARTGPSLPSMLRRFWKALRKEVKYRWHCIMSPPDIWMRHLIAASIAWGRLLSSKGA